MFWRHTIFLHQHPYEIFIPGSTRKVIIGTLPPPRFSLGELKERDVDFCYGSSDNLLWPVLEALYNLELRYDNSREAVEERKSFLRKQHLGICDMVASCKRQKIDAADLGMEEVVLRDLIGQIQECPTIDTLVFVGGNSKNGPEYFFRRQLRESGLSLKCIDSRTPRRHYFMLDKRRIETISLTSPSKAANRAIGSNPYFKSQKQKNPEYSPFDFRVEQYGPIFLTET